MDPSYIFVFDTETSGLPKRKYGRLPCPQSYEDWCRLVQIAWNVYSVSEATKTATLVEKKCFIIKPIDFEIPLDASNIHGITTQFAKENGIEITYLWIYLKEALTKYKNPLLVAHNISFDDGVVLSEMCRNDQKSLMQLWYRSEKECTMKMENPKQYIKLVSLYEKCFNELPTEQLHTADQDVEVCAKCYFHIKKIAIVIEENTCPSRIPL